jgi:glycosyltransferase involved in cell wall biosynthesis
MLGALTVSTLRGESGYQRKEVDKLAHWLKEQPRPDIVNLPNSMLIALARPIRRVVGRPIVVTLQGDDLFLDGLTEPYKTQAIDLIRQQVGDVDLFVSVSDYYTHYMADYLGIPRERMRTVPLGVNVQDFPVREHARRDHARRDAGPEAAPEAPACTIGYLARIAPEKGLHNLAEAYRILRQERGLPPSRLVAAGYMAGDQRPYLERITRTLAAAGLASEFEYLGTIDRDTKVTFLRSIDVLSVPSGYHEPKGLYLLEAMASGVPVVQPNHGAFPEILGKTGGGLLSASEQPSDVADALQTMLSDPEAAISYGRRGAAGVREHYTVQHMTDRLLDVYGELLSDRTHKTQMTPIGAD